ncbi:hypothetical protein ACJVC5_00060 [Peredibacter sp. HCB2-198]|uniref:hypothetical protein n=1 Tax=Peredibacter sp. HCB2-198 TaxID=3383025 RepID=UPI0038B55264
MRTFILMTFILSGHAFAGEFVKKKLQFNFIGDDFGNRIYYRCDSTKKLVENHLATLGASSVLVKCSGGLEDHSRLPQWAPLSITALLDVPLPTENSVREVLVLDSRRSMHEDCFLNVSFLKTAIPLFPGVKVLKKSASCAHSNSRWSYTVEVAK